MADFTYTGPGTGTRSKPRLATLTNWAGAAISLALIVGVGIWGTRVVLRDVSGVPVVLAAEGPMRIAPEDPGGEFADHQGLSVNDVAGNGIASDTADRLTLAPRPLELSEEDVALGIAAPIDPNRPRGDASSATLGEDSESGTETLQSLADQIAAQTAPQSELPAETTGQDRISVDDEGSDTSVDVPDGTEADSINDAI
ncbi:MAG: SPOR domain-containing protein, partial [Rhodobacterales bacterium]